MADFSGYIRLQDGTDELFWNEIDNQGVVEDINQFLGWDDWTVFQLIFYVNPPSIPVPPTEPPTPPGPTDPPTSTLEMARKNYFMSDRIRVFRSDRIRVFTS